VRQAAEEMLKAVRASAPKAHVDGFTVEPMISRPMAVEVLAGIASDPTFGPSILFGQGGVATEIIGDRAIALPPLNAPLARDLVHARIASACGLPR
jgi:acetyltransferase